MPQDLLSIFVSELQRSSFDLHRQGTVYHYTGTAGLEGILSSGVIRASSYRYMNDSSEVRYGREIVAAVFGERSQSSMLDLACRLKHPAFHEESEWRSIIDVSDFEAEDVINFPPSDSARAFPFVELLRGSNDGPRLPITQIIVGPSRDQRASVAAARDLLDRCGYTNTNLSVSQIPLVF